MVQISQSGHQGGFLGSRLTLHGVLLGDDRSAKHKRDQDAVQEFHDDFSSCELRAFNTKFYTCRRWLIDEIYNRCHGSYCFLPKISRSRAVVWAAGSLRILRSSSPITQNSPSMVLPTT